MTKLKLNLGVFTETIKNKPGQKVEPMLKEFEVWYQAPTRKAGVVRAVDLDAARDIARRRYGAASVHPLIVMSKPKL